MILQHTSFPPPPVEQFTTWHNPLELLELKVDSLCINRQVLLNSSQHDIIL